MKQEMDFDFRNHSNQAGDYLFEPDLFFDDYDNLDILQIPRDIIGSYAKPDKRQSFRMNVSVKMWYYLQAISTIRKMERAALFPTDIPSESGQKIIDEMKNKNGHFCRLVIYLFEAWDRSILKWKAKITSEESKRLIFRDFLPKFMSDMDGVAVEDITEAADNFIIQEAVQGGLVPSARSLEGPVNFKRVTSKILMHTTVKKIALAGIGTRRWYEQQNPRTQYENVLARFRANISHRALYAVQTRLRNLEKQKLKAEEGGDIQHGEDIIPKSFVANSYLSGARPFQGCTKVVKMFANDENEEAPFRGVVTDFSNPPHGPEYNTIVYEDVTNQEILAEHSPRNL